MYLGSLQSDLIQDLSSEPDGFRLHNKEIGQDLSYMFY